MIVQYFNQGIMIFKNSILIGVGIYIAILVMLLISKKRGKLEIRRCLPELLLTIYIVAMLKITGIIGMKFYFSYVLKGYYNINLIPFTDTSLLMFILNILLFVPYGFLIPLVFKNKTISYKQIVALGLITTITIEVLQIFSGRCAEADDIIANTLGTMIGFIIYIEANKKLAIIKESNFIV